MQNMNEDEAETFGTGINMFLLSQGKMVKVLEPQSLIEEMKDELKSMDQS